MLREENFSMLRHPRRLNHILFCAFSPETLFRHPDIKYFSRDEIGTSPAKWNYLNLNALFFSGRVLYNFRAVFDVNFFGLVFFFIVVDMICVIRYEGLMAQMFELWNFKIFYCILYSLNRLFYENYLCYLLKVSIFWS